MTTTCGLPFAVIVLSLTSPSQLHCSGSDLLGGQPLGEPGGERHDRQRWIRAALGGAHAAVGQEQIRYSPDAVVCVNDTVLRAGAHARAADQMRVALDREGVLRPRGLQNVLQDPLGVL